MAAESEPELDTLALMLPLPYRIAWLIVFGVWGWGINLQTLYNHKIDVPTLIRYPGRSSLAQPLHHQTVYRLAMAASAVVGSSLLLFWLLTRGDASRVLEADWLPMTTLFGLALLLLVPLPRSLQPAASSHAASSSGYRNRHHPLTVVAALPQDGRRRFGAMLRRVAVGGLAEPQHGRFGDVLLADAITSYAKVLGDLFVCVAMFFTTSASRAASSVSPESVDPSATAHPDRDLGAAVVVPLIMAAPSAARLRQCLIEFVRARRARESGGQHLANALKYASAFPVLVLAAMQTVSPSPSTRQAWILAALVNSLYSFYWDVTNDWDFTLLTSARGGSGSGGGGGGGMDHHFPWGLRRRLYFQPAPLLYYGLIVFDLVLRLTWTLKLSVPRMLGGGWLLPEAGANGEGALFLVELLEAVRRWVWIFFRVETEWIRSTTAASSGGMSAAPLLGAGSDDMMLGEYPSKYEDEDD